MQQVAAVRSVRWVEGEIKRMNYQGEGWGMVREATRGAIVQVLEDHMRLVRLGYLREVAR